MNAPTVQADYYDGRSSRRQRVVLRLNGGWLYLQGESIERRAPLGELRLSEPMGAAPRLATFPDGAYCEIRDAEGFAQILAASGHREHRIVAWQFNQRAIFVAALICLLLGIAGYRYGLPWISAQLAEWVPENSARALSDRVLIELDGRVFTPSKLPPERQTEIAQRFNALRTSDSQPLSDFLRFRAARRLGANAFALPAGPIILTDGIVRLAGNDDELMAVLAHELGHVHARHGLRQMIQGSLVGFFVAWFAGDVSSIIAAAPAALLEAKYSRDLEAEADAYAAGLLRENGISPRCLGDMLDRLEKASGNTPIGDLGHYLSSHPATEERRALLDGPPCH